MADWLEEVIYKTMYHSNSRLVTVSESCTAARDHQVGVVHNDPVGVGVFWPQENVNLPFKLSTCEL